MSDKRVRLVIEGRVQGVYFRASAAEQGAALGLRGWVKNRSDGAVEILAQGEEERVDRLVIWSLGGPPAARVERVVVSNEAVADELGAFAVQR
jgi:acylphosphatase